MGRLVQGIVFNDMKSVGLDISLLHLDICALSREATVPAEHAGTLVAVLSGHEKAGDPGLKARSSVAGFSAKSIDGVSPPSLSEADDGEGGDDFEKTNIPEPGRRHGTAAIAEIRFLQITLRFYMDGK